ncbi:hypothetical protein [Natronorubrum bangense]|uniref:Uncharacterized protein n=2 Tax=Natronorubrum bangense TaxID=61858 RepID=L9WNF2_9EURY|nr:hypothetical protein [Natronorubrum bangense]ELY49878.1 hypothetical protein C494_07705 [Natronorubrum bangense JCM 10635]QCC55497.1 hypothetical protein DV706_14080 [Natronorubrum bangense]
MAQLHNYGEEFILKEAFGSGSGATTFSVGLYDYTGNVLSDSDDVSAITSEPSGSGYARQSATRDSNFTFSLSGGDWQTVIDDLVYDTDDSTESVDGYFVTATFTADGDGSATEHLLFSGQLDQTYDLGSVTTFTMQGSGISLD